LLPCGQRGNTFGRGVGGSKKQKEKKGQPGKRHETKGGKASLLKKNEKVPGGENEKALPGQPARKKGFGGPKDGGNIKSTTYWQMGTWGGGGTGEKEKSRLQRRGKGRAPFSLEAKKRLKKKGGEERRKDNQGRQRGTCCSSRRGKTRICREKCAWRKAVKKEGKSGKKRERRNRSETCEVKKEGKRKRAQPGSGHNYEIKKEKKKKKNG